VKLILIIILVIAILLGCGFGIGYTYCEGNVAPKIVKEVIVKLPDSYYERNHPSPIDINKALEYLAEARYTHLYWRDAEHPAFTTNREREEEWIKRYDQIMDLLESFRN